MSQYPNSPILIIDSDEEVDDPVPLPNPQEFNAMLANQDQPPAFPYRRIIPQQPMPPFELYDSEPEDDIYPYARPPIELDSVSEVFTGDEEEDDIQFRPNRPVLQEEPPTYDNRPRREQTPPPQEETATVLWDNG
jgi:hypothetical protein